MSSTTDYLIEQLAAMLPRDDFPGDPLFIQCRSIRTFHMESCGTPFGNWIRCAELVYLIDQKGRVFIHKDRNGLKSKGLSKWGKHLYYGYLDDLFSVEEMLTHDQPPVRNWGLFYAGRRA